MQTRETRIYKVTVAGSIVNLLLLLFKFISGILGNSAAMVADAVHSLSDFVTDIIVLVFVNVSSKPEDEDHEYGHGKYETLASLTIGLALAVVGAMIMAKGVSSIVAVFNGETLPRPGIIALVAALLSIVLKELIFRVTRKVANEVDSSALEANAWHHRSDALSSIGTAAGVGGAILLGSKWTVLDPVAAVIVSCFILVTAAQLIRKACDELLEKSLPSDMKEQIKALVYEEPEVCDIHHLRTRKVGNRLAIEMHLRLPGEMSLSEAHEHASNIEKRLRENYGSATHVMLHLEPKK